MLNYFHFSKWVRYYMFQSFAHASFLPEMQFSFPNPWLRNISLSLSYHRCHISKNHFLTPLSSVLLPVTLALLQWLLLFYYIGSCANFLIYILNCLLESRDHVLDIYHQHLSQSLTCNRYRINILKWVGLNWAELQSGGQGSACK